MKPIQRMQATVSDPETEEFFPRRAERVAVDS